MTRAHLEVVLTLTVPEAEALQEQLQGPKADPVYEVLSAVLAQIEQCP